MRLSYPLLCTRKTAAKVKCIEMGIEYIEDHRLEKPRPKWECKCVLCTATEEELLNVPTEEHWKLRGFPMYASDRHCNRKKPRVRRKKTVAME